MKKSPITQEELKRVLHYNPNTGIFTYVMGTRKMKPGSVAGHYHKASGYNKIMINYKLYQSHRLAFLYMEGYFPEHDVDHKYGNRSDNRWLEIRHATRRCNMQNQKMNKANTSGFPGVTWDKVNKKWFSMFKINRKAVNLGRYNTPLDAALARFTMEAQCDEWACDYRSELVRAIKLAWPEFNPKN